MSIDSKQEKAATAKLRANRRAAVREQELGHLTAEQIATGTRGLSVAAYAKAYSAGANPRDESDLDDRLDRYLARGVKTDAHEQAFLDGNTYRDELPEAHLRERIENPSQH